MNNLLPRTYFLDLRDRLDLLDLRDFLDLLDLLDLRDLPPVKLAAFTATP